MGAKSGGDQRRRGLFEEGTKRGGDFLRGGQKRGNQMKEDLRLGDQKSGDEMNDYRIFLLEFLTHSCKNIITY